MSNHLALHRTLRAATCVAAIFAAGCGGGGGGEAPPSPELLTITGTAVEGVALDGATISVKCATGNGTGVSTSAGTYEVQVTGGALPCVLNAAGSHGPSYHSLVPGTGTSGIFTANISPLTEMVVSHVAREQPSAYFAGFGAGSTVPPASVALANAYVQTAMAGLTDLTGVNVITDPLSVGNALDQKIDQVMAGLADAGLTVGQVTTAIVANPLAPSVVATPLAPSTVDCSWFKSGKYRIVMRSETDPALRFLVATFDASALTFTDPGNAVVALTFDSACQFSANEPEAIVKFIVSPAGLLVIHAESKTVASDRELSLALPEQTLPISELAGTWNGAKWDPTRIGITGEAVAYNTEVTIDASGQITAAKTCVGLSPCVPQSAPLATFSANAAGGFDLAEVGVVTGRAFLFKTLAGEKAMLLLTNDDALAIIAPKQPATLPVAATVYKSRSAVLSVPFGASTDEVGPLAEYEFNILSVDATANTETRILVPVNRVDIRTYNTPREGLLYRPLNSCTTNGVPSFCNETVYLPLPAMGVTVALPPYVQPAGSYFEIGVIEP